MTNFIIFQLKGEDSSVDDLLASPERHKKITKLQTFATMTISPLKALNRLHQQQKKHFPPAIFLHGGV